MDQIKENCSQPLDLQLFDKLYQREVMRRSHSFYMRKEIKIAGRNLEDIQKSLLRIKR